MKKFYLFIALFLITGFLFAQSVKQIEVPQTSIYTNVKVLKHPVASNHQLNASPSDAKQPNSTSYIYRWLGYGDAMQTYNGISGFANVGADYLFPDSTVIVHYTNAKQPPYYHSLAVVLDPYDSTVFWDDTKTLNFGFTTVNSHYGRNTSYTIDSVEIPYIYIRTSLDNSEMDTIAVDYITDLHGPIGGFAGEMANYNVDTTWFCQLDAYKNLTYRFDTAGNSTIPVPNIKTVKYAIGIADTTPKASKVLALPAPADMGYGTSLCAIAWRFIPGYSWIRNDTLNASKPQNNDYLNSFRFLAYFENGSSTETSYPRYAQGYFNESEFYTTQSMRKTSNNGWGNTYIPRLAYPLGQFDNLDVYFHLKAVAGVGIAQVKENTISLSQNMPNPAGNSTVIHYSLPVSNNISLVITDLTGKQVMKINEGKQMAGNHTIYVNTSDFNSGMYFYTLNTDNSSLTKKMIINK